MCISQQISSFRHGFRGRSKTTKLSSIMDIPVVLRSLSDVIHRYDAVLLDQFGVLHDGETAIDGSINAVNQIKGLGIPVLILSNTSKRKRYVIDQLDILGFKGMIDDVICSGELAYQYLYDRYGNSNKSGKKGRFAWVTWDPSNEPWTDGLNICPSDVESADFLLFHGTKRYVTSTENVDIELELFRNGNIDKCIQRDMNIGVDRGIPAICCNQDYKAILPGGEANFMPGVLREAYEGLGGKVISWGKPNQEFFEAAMNRVYKLYVDSMLSRKQAEAPKKRQNFRVLHIGDSIHHDIAGAATTKGCDSLMVLKHGVHKDAIYAQNLGRISTMLRPSDQGDGDDTEITAPDDTFNTKAPGIKQQILSKTLQICDEERISRPTYIIEELKW